MKIQQLSVFVENKGGRLAEITEVLAKANIDIRAISIADTSDFGILRLIVNRPDEAVKALKDANMTVSLTNVIAIGITDKPGEFAKAMKVLADDNIVIEYMYAFISRNKGRAFVILRVNDEEQAVRALSGAGIMILPSEEIHGM